MAGRRWGETRGTSKDGLPGRPWYIYCKARHQSPNSPGSNRLDKVLISTAPAFSNNSGASNLAAAARF